jgi:hypothetical protein
MKRSMNIERPTRSQLRHLRISTGAQNRSHLHEDILEGKDCFGRLVIGVQHLEQRRGTGTSRATGGIRQLKAGHIGHVGARLFVAAARDHVHHRRNHFFGLGEIFRLHGLGAVALDTFLMVGRSASRHGVAMLALCNLRRRENLIVSYITFLPYIKHVFETRTKKTNMVGSLTFSACSLKGLQNLQPRILLRRGTQPLTSSICSGRKNALEKPPSHPQLEPSDALKGLKTIPPRVESFSLRHSQLLVPLFWDHPPCELKHHSTCSSMFVIVESMRAFALHDLFGGGIMGNPRSLCE